MPDHDNDKVPAPLADQRDFAVPAAEENGPSPVRPRVAVVGAGPSGLFTAAALANSGIEVDIDVLDRLPAPYGLVRYGVAPDHARMKTVINTLREPLRTGRARFLGNVPVGSQPGVPPAVLRQHYHAVVYATGCSVDRALGIPGEDLIGSLSSGQFVGWYSGHPDQADLRPPLDHPAAAVIGGGNVALDVARMLARTADELATTDIPDQVYAALRASAVRDVHILIRRGPRDVRFTPVELRQLGQLADADVVVHDEGLLADPSVPAAADRRQQQNLRTLTGWLDTRPTRARRIHLRFLRTPVRLVGAAGRVSALVAERHTMADGRIVPTGVTETLPVGLVVRAIGYTAEPIPELPFDTTRGVVPNTAGRVVRDGAAVPGAYVAGWLKRGPSGVIGTNKADATETAQAVLADLPALSQRPLLPRTAFPAALAAAGIEWVDWNQWLRLDAAEIQLGATRSAERIKLAELDEMLAACRTGPRQG